MDSRTRGLFVLFAVMAAVLGFFMGYGSQTTAFAGLGFLVLAIGMLDTRATAFVFFFLSLVYHELVRQFIPGLEATHYLMDISILALFVRVLLDRASDGRFRLTVVLLPAAAWIGLSVFSAWWNHINPMAFALKMRQMILFPMLFFALVNARFSTRTLRNLFYWAFGLSFLHIPVALWEFKLVGMSDNVKGFTPGGPELTFLVLWAVGVLFGLYLYTRKINLLAMVGISGLFLILPVMSGIRAAFFLYPGFAVYLLLAPVLVSKLSKQAVSSFLKKSTKALGSVAAAGALAVLSVPQVRSLYDMLYKTLVWGMHFQSRAYSAFHVGRLVAPKIAHSYLSVKGLPGLLVGYSIGSVVQSKFSKFVTKQITFTALTSQLSVSMYEMGYLGLAMYALMALGVVWYWFKLLRTRLLEDHQRVMAFSFGVCAVLYFVMTAYYWVWIEHIAGTLFWGIGGLVASAFYANKEREHDTSDRSFASR